MIRTFHDVSRRNDELLLLSTFRHRQCFYDVIIIIVLLYIIHAMLLLFILLFILIFWCVIFKATNVDRGKNAMKMEEKNSFVRYTRITKNKIIRYYEVYLFFFYVWFGNFNNYSRLSIYIIIDRMITVLP